MVGPELEGVPFGLPPDTPVFTVPAGLIRILNRDLKFAGIPKVDERGRTVDVHALRTTFGTLLSKGGVAPRTAQAAMRHSTIDLTMNVYTDPKLLDVAGAVESLPALPLAGAAPQQAKATGTNDAAPETLAPTLAPTLRKRGKSGTIPVKLAVVPPDGDATQPVDVTPCPLKRKHPLSTSDNGCLKERERGFEPPTSSLGS